MQCDICFRVGGSKLPFLCPTDARNRLYELRLQNARVLLEKDSLDRQIATCLSGDHRSKGQVQLEGPLSRHDVNISQAEKNQVLDKTRQIIVQADELRAKVECARKELTKMKANISRRKSDLASALGGTEARRARQVDDIEKSIRIRKYKWNQEHATMASNRTFLCGEAAKLYGLKRVRRNSGSEEYSIGGTAIMDLRALNTATPALISTALSHIVHLLVLSTHYLAIRLPAEIILPHRDYPMPTIFPLLSSYKYSDVPFPGSTPTSPENSKHTVLPTQPRPRPLFIHKPLPIISTEDPAGYGLFLEGVTLLAYNVAWLCKSQGVLVGDEGSFEDICDIGKNLYNLLIGTNTKTKSASSRGTSAQSTPSKNGRLSETDSEGRGNALPSIMGKYSHGAAHSNLGSAEGTELIRSWKLSSPIKLADKLKSQLMSEVANAEWEMLNADSWQIDDEMGGDGVVVGERKERERGLRLGMQSFMSMRTVMDAAELIGGNGERKPGTSGWTKLKPR